jgi:hypothetical protein
MVETEVMEQKLTYKEFYLRYQGRIDKPGGLSLLLLGALKFLHGEERHPESEWLSLYGTMASRTTS